MKIFLCASKSNYHRIPPLMEELQRMGHAVTPPNSYDDPFKENRLKEADAAAHCAWKADMIRLQAKKISANDAIFVLNFDKGEHKNYIGGATFLEVFKAFELGKKIFFYNPLPEGILKDELLGMNPAVIHGDLRKIS